jgi:hypothetical protein
MPPACGGRPWKDAPTALRRGAQDSVGRRRRPFIRRLALPHDDAWSHTVLRSAPGERHRLLTDTARPSLLSRWRTTTQGHRYTLARGEIGDASRKQNVPASMRAFTSARNWRARHRLVSWRATAGSDNIERPRRRSRLDASSPSGLAPPVKDLRPHVLPPQDAIVMARSRADRAGPTDDDPSV